MITKRTLLSFLPVFAIPVVANAKDLPKRHFIQMWTEGPEENLINDDTDIGRIEVSMNGEFVACAQGKAIQTWNGLALAEISVGFTITGDPNQLKFELYGEMKRTTKLLTKFTAI